MASVKYLIRSAYRAVVFFVWSQFGGQSLNVENLSPPSSTEASSGFENLSRFKRVRVFDPRARIVTSIDPEKGKFIAHGWGEKGTLTEKQVERLPLLVRKRKMMKGTFLITDFVANPENLYHFYLHNILPVFFVQRKLRLENAPLLLLKDPTRYQKQLLKYLGIKSVTLRKQAVCEELLAIRTSDSSVAEYLGYFRNSPERREVASENSGKQIKRYRRVYLARRTRRPSNQSAVSKIARKFGYQKIYMEDLSFFDQIALGSTVEDWLVDHGAGLIHAIWGTPESVVEILPPTASGVPFGSRCFEPLLRELNSAASYLPITGVPRTSGSARNDAWIPFSAPIQEIESALGLVALRKTEATRHAVSD
jgi:hypothetical protein